MAEGGEGRPPMGPVPEARAVPKKRTPISLVWVIPIVAALVGVWVAVTRVLSEGPKITIVFQSAEGLEAGKTKVHFNGVDIGTVSAIRLSEDHQAGDHHGANDAEDGGFPGQGHPILGRQSANFGGHRERFGNADFGAYSGLRSANSKERRPTSSGSRRRPL